MAESKNEIYLLTYIFSPTHNISLSVLQQVLFLHKNKDRIYFFNLQVQPHNIRNFALVQKVALTVEVAVNQGGGAFNKELEILVTPESGYLFVITDQPVYK